MNSRIFKRKIAGFAEAKKHRALLFATLCTSLFVSSCNSHKLAPDGKAVAVVEDEVYETVVRDLVAPNEKAHVSQLVFNKNGLSDFTLRGDENSCKENVLKNFQLRQSAPTFNTFADRAYRFLTHSGDDSSLQASAIENSVEKLCQQRPLSTSFHTDLPRVFIDPSSIDFDIQSVPTNGMRDFHKIYPGAAGIISMSGVGFDPSLREGTVTVAFVCGSLCGTGWRYIVKKTSNKWVVTQKWIIWVS